MTTIILLYNKNVHYYNSAEGDFSAVPVECDAEFFEQARQVQIYNKYRGELSIEELNIIDYDEDTMIENIF